MSNQHTATKTDRVAKALADALALQDRLTSHEGRRSTIALRRKHVALLTGLSNSSIDYAIRHYGFPRGFAITPGRTAWDANEVQRWLLSRKSAKDSSWPRVEDAKRKRHRKAVAA